MVIHINHADEITLEVQRALALMVDNGIPLLSQSVLLRGVNDTVEALTNLMRALVVQSREALLSASNRSRQGHVAFPRAVG